MKMENARKSYDKFHGIMQTIVKGYAPDSIVRNCGHCDEFRKCHGDDECTGCPLYDFKICIAGIGHKDYAFWDLFYILEDYSPGDKLSEDDQVSALRFASIVYDRICKDFAEATEDFKPINFSIVIDSPEMLKELWLRMNLATNIIAKAYIKEPASLKAQRFIKEIKGHESTEIWARLDAIIKSREI